MKIFIVTSHLPYPGVAHGGGTSMVSNIRYLSVRNEVLLASMYEAGERDRLGAMAEHATLVVAEQTITGTQLNAAAGVQQEAAAGGWALNRLILRSLLGWLLRTFLDCDLRPKPAPETARFLRDVLAKIDELRPDIVQVEFLQLGALLEPGLRAKGIPAVIVAQDVEMKQMHRRLCRAPGGDRKSVV